MKERVINAWAFLWALGYLYIAVPIWCWYRVHRFDADYFMHLGFAVGLILSVIILIWEAIA